MKFAKNILEHLYLVERLSITKIAKYLNSNYSTVYRCMIYYGIPLRNKNDYPIWNIGRPHSEATKEKIGAANKKIKHKPLSDLTKEKIGAAHRGKKVSIETRKKISNNHANVRGVNNPMYNKKHSVETRKKITHAIKTKIKLGKDHHWYKEPGKRKTILSAAIRACAKYKTWRTLIFTRDKFTCVWCANVPYRTKSVYLNADHIVPFSQILKNNNVTTLEQAYLCQDLWNLDNGRTLCVECHKKTSRFGRK